MFQQLCRSLFKHNKLLYNYVNKARPSSSSGTMNLDVEAERIIWMDLEMTGLEPETCHILEVACIVTDAKLNVVAEGPDLIINQPSEILDNMTEWCISQHGKTGLTEASRNSKISLGEAEKIILTFFHEHVPPRICPLAGSTVYMDRLFLRKYMPQVSSYMHYRLIDASTVKELCRRWNPEVYRKAPAKQFLHRSLADIKESIDEMRWYREHFMKITV